MGNFGLNVLNREIAAGAFKGSHPLANILNFGNYTAGSLQEMRAYASLNKGLPGMGEKMNALGIADKMAALRGPSSIAPAIHQNDLLSGVDRLGTEYYRPPMDPRRTSFRPMSAREAGVTPPISEIGANTLGNPVFGKNITRPTSMPSGPSSAYTEKYNDIMSRRRMPYQERIEKKMAFAKSWRSQEKFAAESAANATVPRTMFGASKFTNFTQAVGNEWKNKVARNIVDNKPAKTFVGRAYGGTKDVFRELTRNAGYARGFNKNLFMLGVGAAVGTGLGVAGNFLTNGEVSTDEHFVKNTFKSAAMVGALGAIPAAIAFTRPANINPMLRKVAHSSNNWMSKNTMKMGIAAAGLGMYGTMSTNFTKSINPNNGR